MTDRRVAHRQRQAQLGRHRWEVMVTTREREQLKAKLKKLRSQLKANHKPPTTGIEQ